MKDTKLLLLLDHAQVGILKVVLEEWRHTYEGSNNIIPDHLADVVNPLHATLTKKQKEILNTSRPIILED